MTNAHSKIALIEENYPIPTLSPYETQKLIIATFRGHPELKNDVAYKFSWNWNKMKWEIEFWRASLLYPEIREQATKTLPPPCLMRRTRRKDGIKGTY